MINSCIPFEWLSPTEKNAFLKQRSNAPKAVLTDETIRTAAEAAAAAHYGKEDWRGVYSPEADAEAFDDMCKIVVAAAPYLVAGKNAEIEVARAEERESIFIMLERFAEIKEASCRGTLGSMFAAQSASDLRSAVNAIRAGTASMRAALEATNREDKP